MQPDSDYYVRTHGGRGGRVETSFDSLVNAVSFARLKYGQSEITRQHVVLYYRGIRDWIAFVPLGQGFIRAYELDRRIVRQAKAKAA